MRFNKNIYFKFKTTIELFLLIIILSDNFHSNVYKKRKISPDIAQILIALLLIANIVPQII